RARDWFRPRRFAEFPNPHLRTNGFMAAREVLLQLRVPPIRNKDDAHRFESGVHGFTAQLKGLGLRSLLVGADGKAYEPAEWPESRTFRLGDQDNLLMADNQTRTYLAADADTRRKLSNLAWGARAPSTK
ncbi:MAG TPA: hypothetical protein VHE37_08060, partial [Nevskiaceae bacterium]|nr:hypothetical protein [Nevskiaceae bacterium]